MAIGVPTVDELLNRASKTLREELKPFGGGFRVQGSAYMYYELYVWVEYNGHCIEEHSITFDSSQLDDSDLQRIIGEAIGQTAKALIERMMDPDGDLKTLSAREVYAGDRLQTRDGAGRQRS